MLLVALLLQAAASPPTGYWQQHVSYDISASLDEPAGVLRGRQRVVYRNRSPDTLRSIAFHLYLNAFRPGSRWADADSAEGRRRFNDLRDPDYGFNHVSDVRIDGRPVVAEYPFAPDSTVVRFALPAPLPPGDSLVAEMGWDARPSTLPRRQGRRGRAFDFAQWYPRVVAYDRLGWQEHPLYPAGEFYGEFGDYTVRLDVPVDQVVGATGVPACGDPGWQSANQSPRPIDYQRDRYPRFAAGLGASACAPSGPGRKTLVWRAEDVHHFAMSMRPDYRYEGGSWNGIAVHVLYQPGDERTWGGGVAVRRTEAALEWLDGLFGAYPWPQITNVHRLEGGGTEFPMMIMDGSASQGLIVHELGHNYVMGILANNEWREGWLDEGFTSFQTTWFFEEDGPGDGRGQPGARERAYDRLERTILDWDLDGWSEPVSLESEKYRDFATYGTMIYARGELFFHQLREIVGDDVMRRILRAYYARWKLRHVDEAAFRAVAEEVSGRDLSTFFGQWLHGTVLYDYAVGRVRSSRVAGGAADAWVTRVEVVRKGDGIFPVDVRVRSREDTAVVRADGIAERGWVEVVTRGRPREVLIDPRARSHDWNMMNNRRTRGLLWWGRPGGRDPDWMIDRVFSERSHRDRPVQAILPTVWYNEPGGAMVGVRVRSNYMGRFSRWIYEGSVATDRCCEDGQQRHHWYVQLENPTWLRLPRGSVAAHAFRQEGRQGAGVRVEQRRKGHPGSGPVTSLAASLRWVAVYDADYPSPLEYDNAGTAEAVVEARSADRRGPWTVTAAASLGAGVEYRNRGVGATTGDRYDAQPYARLWGEITARRPLGARSSLGIRGFAGWVAADRDPVRQRWFGVSGADPYENLRNPFLRSRDALLTGDVHFHAPGGGNVRGLDPTVAATRLAALNVELDRQVLSRPRAAIAREVRVAAFGDAAWTDGFFSVRSRSDVAADAGVGIRVGHRIGDTDFVTRVDLPLWVSHPDRGVGASSATDRAFRLRWTVGLDVGW